MSTATSTFTITRSHTATHLSEAIGGMIAEILGTLGISARTLMNDWEDDYAPAIRAWIEEGSLKMVIVECRRPSGAVDPILEFPVEYHADGSGEFSHRHVALARSLAKLSKVQTGTIFKIICSYNGYHTPQDGWSTTSRASTAGLRSNTLGSLASGPHASASVRYLTSR